MSSYQQCTFYTKKQLQLQSTNLHVAAHDLTCSCEKPLQHIILQILEQEPSLKEDKQFTENLQKCLTTTEKPTGHEDDVLGDIGDGDLEKLFEEDFGEDTDG